MEKFISIPVPISQFFKLMDISRSNDSSANPIDLAITAIDSFIDNVNRQSETLSKISKDSRGYQWKSLFLPHGTKIRMPYKGKYAYARVEGDDIFYKEEIISPGSLANRIAGSSRNAWRDLWIKRPMDREWKLSDDCRSKERERNLFQRDIELVTSASER